MHRIVVFFAMVLAVLAFAGSQGDLTAIAEHFKNGSHTKWTWVFYGDSITHGAKHTHGWRSFPEIFAERVRFELGRPMDAIINSGNSGYSSVELVQPEEYDWQVRRFHPNVVLILIGSNDIVRKNAGLGEGFRARLTQLVNSARADGAIPLLQTYPTIAQSELPEYIQRYQQFPECNRIIREVAQQNDVILVDHDLYWRTHFDTPEKLNEQLGETIHPGALGHLTMAIELFKALGIYAPSSLCCNVVPGGVTVSMPAPRPGQATWLLEYQGNALPAPAVFSSGYRPQMVSLVDDNGEKFLQLDHTAKWNAMFTLRKPELFNTLPGKTVCIDLQLRFPNPERTANRFFFGFSYGEGAARREIILLFKSNGFSGSVSHGYTLTPKGDLQLTIRIPPDGNAAVFQGDKPIAQVNATRGLSKLPPHLFFGNGSATIEDIVQLKALRIGFLSQP